MVKAFVRSLLTIIIPFIGFNGLLMSCGGGNGTSALLPQSTGKSGELLIVIDTADWNSVLGESLKACFAAPYPGLPQEEPYFDIIHIAPEAFSSIFRTTTCIMKVEVGQSEKAGFRKSENVWARDQLYMVLSANNTANAAAMVNKRAEELREWFKKTEIDRLQKTIVKTADPQLGNIVEEQAGVSLSVPADFNKVTSANGMAYFRRDRQIGAHNVIQGLVCYSFPYEQESDLSMAHLVAQRDAVTKRLVKGQLQEEYMKVYREYEPDTATYQVKGHYVKELRGLWKMEGAFMGGPFLHLALVDEKGGRVVCLDGFVYGPKFNKREYIRQLEGILKTAELTGQKQ